MPRIVVWSLCVLLAATAAASPVSLVSRADSGLLADTGGAHSFTGLGLGSQISADGRYIAFSSEAGNLVAGQADANTTVDLFLHDRVAGTTVLVSHRYDSAVTAGNGRSFHPAVSDDGRSVAFLSLADDLVAGQDVNGHADAFLYDRVTGTVTLVSHGAGSATTAGDGRAQDVAISADGNYVAFAGTSTNLVSGQVSPDGGFSLQVFLYHRPSGALSLASHAAGSATTAASGGSSVTPALSDDGRYVAYTSGAVDLVAGGIDGAIDDVYLYDRTTGANVLVSHAHGSAVTSGDSESVAPRISADSRYVAYMSLASNLVAGVTDGGGRYDVFLFDRDAGTNVLVSRAAGSATTPGGGTSQLPRLSDDGAWVVFKSSGQDMVAGETSSGTQIFLYERATGTVSFVPAGAAEATPGAGSLNLEAEISGDGTAVVFTSASPDLVPGYVDFNALLDVFLYDRTAGTVLLVSRTVGPAKIAGSGLWPEISYDGGVVAFTSFSADLDADAVDTNRANDVFVYDRATETNAVASRRAPGLPSVSGNDDSGGDTLVGSAVSADGRWVAFTSRAGNLVPGQVDVLVNLSNVFLHDRETGATVLVSHAAGSTFTEASGASSQPVLSADGRFVAFLSTATDLVSGQVEGNAGGDVFLYDREGRTVILVSRTAASAATTGSGSSEAPAISADGRLVAFQSLATDLVSGPTDGNSASDVFLFDRTTGTTVLVSRSAAAAATTGNRSATAPLLNAEGTRVAFLSLATDLVAGQADTNMAPDLFLYDIAAGTTTLVSHVPGLAATAGNNVTGPFSLSADGSRIAFVSLATDLAAGRTDANLGADIFLFEAATGAVTLISHAAGSPATAADSHSFVPWVSADGAWLAFMSYASDLVPGQTNVNAGTDVFLREIATGATRLVSHAAGTPSTTADRDSAVFGISADGRHVAFTSKATNLVSGQGQGFPASMADLTREGWNVFLYDRDTGESLLASRALSSPLLTGNKDSEAPVLSADGSTVVFRSGATDLIAGDYNQRDDLFAFDNGLPGRFFTVPPCRLLDTRQPQEGPALASGVVATLHLHGVCGIPETAKAVAVNVTVTQPAASGHLTLSAGDSPVPAASTINFGAGQTRANNAVLRLAGNATGRLAARAFLLDGGTVHLLLDVTGYFE